MRIQLAALIIAAAIGLVLSAQQKKSTWDGVYTTAQAERGRMAYDGQCAECHGADLTGVDFTPGVTGVVFTGNWDTLPMGTLFDRVRVTMPLNRENSLSRQQYADIVAYTLSRNGFPTGETELPTQIEELNQIVFLATKP